MHTTVETRIAAPPEVVFAMVTDIARWPRIVTAIEHIELLTPGQIGVGTRFRETRRMFGREAAEEMTVAEFEPPHRFVLTAFNHGTRYRAEHLLAAADGATRLRLVFQSRPESWFARLMVPLGLFMMGHVKKQLAADIADLKRAVERAGQ